MTAARTATGLLRERFVTLAALAALASLSWLYLWTEASRMAAMPATGMMDMPGSASPWNSDSLLLTFVMWAVMMVGMMLPSAAPAILLYGSIAKKNRADGSILPATWVFASGYLFVWTLFSVAATVLQAAFQETRLLTPAMASASTWLSGVLLVAAGVYQWLPVKGACLEKCRSPLQLFLFHWRPGTAGAFRMGVEHGWFCVGCCWALMLLLFAAGVMNLLWVAVIAGFVLIEKVLPGGTLIGRLGGIGLALTGAGVIIAGL
ncbi:MAG TPA: DUF2182 domain-containing protein [Gammaproteobacteria bacterium]|nr:DUF2182 domain-containing protein [Gammaproteobacteria bacterium]